jgi:hypothetical protein
MNNLTHAERATLDIVFARYPDDMTYNEILTLLQTEPLDFLPNKQVVPRECFEGFFKHTDLISEIYRIQLIIIDTLLAFNQERHQRVMATIR